MSDVERCDLSSYTELAALLDGLPTLVQDRRRRDRLSIRAAAAQAGCSFSTLDRWERGDTGRSIALVASVLRWLDEPSKPASDVGGAA